MGSDQRPARPWFDSAAALAPLREELTGGALLARWTRLRSRLWLIVQAAVGAMLAWYVAHQLLGHPLPFFAPITAMICLGMTYGDRVRRIVELTVGVALGILVGDQFVHTFGSGTWQILAVCLVAMSLAVLASSGQLLMMQAGIQGVIVTTLIAGEGEAFSRWMDAVVGGAVALLIAVLAPQRSTTMRPRERAIGIVGNLALVLTDTAQGLRNADQDRTRAALARARELSRELDALRDAAAEASAAVRVAPLLSRRHRREVEEIRSLLSPLDLAIRNVRVLVRRADVAVEAGEFVPSGYTDLVVGLAQAAATVQEHLEQQLPLSQGQEDLIVLARRSTWGHPKAGLSAEVLRAQVRSTVVDLLIVSGMSWDEARHRVPPTRDEMDPEAQHRDPGPASPGDGVSGPAR